MLHDRLSTPASAIEGVVGIDLGGATWVLVGLVLAAGVAGLLGRFVLSLPHDSRRDLTAGAGLFLLGAVGFEIVSNLAFETTGTLNAVSAATMHVEELLEFVGVILAIRGLLRLVSPGRDRSPLPTPTD